MAKSPKLKIVMLSHSSELGGAERSMMDLLDHWVKQGWVEPHLIVRIPMKNMVPELKKRGWHYYPIHYTNWSQRKPSQRSEDVYRNARENARATNEIEAVLQKVKPDVVMTNTIVSPWAAIAAYFQRVPHVWFVREYGDIDHQHVFEIGREKMFEDIDTMSAMIVTNSETLASHVKQYVTPTKVRALYTPFDIDLLDRKTNESAPNPFKFEDSLKIVVTGRISPSKGQDEAARAVGELTREGLSAELCVIGTPADPADADVLKKIIKEYGIEDRVHLLGQQANPLAIVKHADIGIMASQQEAFGRVTFEYMVTGRPVVGANSGATPELIISNENGFLYKKNDIKDLTKQLRKYATNHELITRHGQKARERAETMLQGKNSADHLYQTLLKMLEKPELGPRPLNFARKWLNYPLIAQDYIDESQVLSFRRLLYIKLRGFAKTLYLAVVKSFNKDKHS